MGWKGINNNFHSAEATFGPLTRWMDEVIRILTADATESDSLRNQLEKLQGRDLPPSYIRSMSWTIRTLRSLPLQNPLHGDVLAGVWRVVPDVHPDEGAGLKWTWMTSLHQIGSSKNLTQICEEQKSQLLWQSLFSSEQTGRCWSSHFSSYMPFTFILFHLSLIFFAWWNVKLNDGHHFSSYSSFTVHPTRTFTSTTPFIVKKGIKMHPDLLDLPDLSNVSWDTADNHELPSYIL